MKYCSKCGKELFDEAVYCPGCGCAAAPQKQAQDAPNMGFAVLCFFFPLLGLILYLIWKDTMPLRAKSAGKGALIGVIAYAALYVLSWIAIVSFIGLSIFML